MGRYANATNEELDLYIYMARERLATAESLQISAGMTDNVIYITKHLHKLIDALKADLWAVEDEIHKRPTED